MKSTAQLSRLVNQITPAIFPNSLKTDNNEEEQDS